jgi:2'-5' RNA ligase
MVREMDMPRRSAIVVPFRLPPDLDAIRVREIASARAGAPAHVTLLFPFVPAAELTETHLDGVAAVIASVPAFDVWLREVRRWDPGDGAPEGVIWLDPEPSAPFITLIDALGRAFPDYPPYGGFHDTIIPHLTLASDDRRQLRAVQTAAAAALPLRRRVSAAILIVEGGDGRWRTHRRFPMAPGAGPLEARPSL